MSFISELKRRNVFRVAGVYAVVGWLLVQVAAAIEEAIFLPAWFDTVVVAFLAIGFPIALVFAWAFELTPEGIKPTAAVAPGESITARTGSRLDLVLIIALLIFGAGMFVPGLLRDGGVPGFGAPAATAAPSIAVLPFADLSPDGNQEYFADGISEELLNVLAKVPGMKVAGRTSSFAFKGRNEDLREIGRVLDVAHILEGSVRSQGDRVRVTAQLIQVSDGFHLWSETYDRDMQDIFAVQDDIAERILVAMKERLLVDSAPVIVPATRTDIGAYGLFLEARDLIYTRDKDKMQRALELLNEAIAIDAAYAPAYAARALAVNLLSDRPGSYGDIPAGEALTRAQADVETALELDPQLPEAYAVQGLNYADMGRPDFAISSLRRSLELNPNSLDARNWLAIALGNNGRLRDQFDQAKKLVEIDPLYEPGVSNGIGYALELDDIAAARDLLERFKSASRNSNEARRLEATIARYEGEEARALRLLESIPAGERQRRTESDIRFTYIHLGENRKDAPMAEVLPAYGPYELALFGDTSGAVALARVNVEKAPDFYTAHTVYVNVLSDAREDEALAAYYREEFDGDLDVFEARLRPAVSSDPPPYRRLALAMRTIGDTATYEAAMQRWRFTIDAARVGGSKSIGLDVDDARYWAIAGDVDRSIEYLQRALARDTDWLEFWVWIDRSFDALRDDPRFLALREDNLRRLNAIRTELELPPLPDDFYERYADL